MPLLKIQKTYPSTWPAGQQRNYYLLLHLLLLLIMAHYAIAGPVANPEISGKSNQQTNLVNVGANQQQQQQSSLKANSQEAQLNTLNAYAAANYDSFSETDFKPSYKIPDMEANFTPMQSHINIGTSNALSGPLPSPTPVIMQYLPPQSLQENGVQYLQLIPTRPLIVPISPFISQQSPAVSSPYHQALTAENTIGEYAHRAPTVLTPLHANTNAVQPTTPTIVNVQAPHLPYGLHTYANAIQPYRANFRINREIKDKHLPMGLTLNLNEYFPGVYDMAHNHHHHPMYIRGRP